MANKDVPKFFVYSEPFIPVGLYVSVFDPTTRYIYDRVRLHVVDDILDVMGQATNDRVIPVASAAYKVVVMLYGNTQYWYNDNVTAGIYNRVKAILDHAGCRPDQVNPRIEPVLTEHCMPDLEHCLSSLSLRASSLSAKFKRARDMPHFVRERETTGRSQMAEEFNKMYWLKKERDALLAAWGQISTVDKFYRICRTFLNGPNVCLNYNDRDPVSGKSVTYILLCIPIVRQFSNLDWDSRRMLLPNVVVYLKQNIDAVKANVLDRDDRFVIMDNLARCIVREMRDILEAMLVLNVIYRVYWGNLQVVEACADAVCHSMRSAIKNIVPSHMDCFFRFAAGHADYEQRMRNRRDVDRVVRKLCKIPRWMAVSRWARDKLDDQS